MHNKSNKFDTYINTREVIQRTASSDEQKDYTNTVFTGISLVYTVNNWYHGKMNKEILLFKSSGVTHVLRIRWQNYPTISCSPGFHFTIYDKKNGFIYKGFVIVTKLLVDEFIFKHILCWEV